MTKTQRPHDAADLYLAPVALRLDERLDELAGLSGTELRERIGLEANVDPDDPHLREDGLVQTIVHLLELHGWSAGLAERGLRLSHDGHALVLGLPANCRAFLDRDLAV